MGKFVPDATNDAFLAKLATATRIDVTSDASTPTNLTNTLANTSLAGGDFTNSDGAVSGRMVTVAQKAGVSITGNGTAKHIVTSLDGTIIDITTCTDQVLTSGGTVTLPAWTHTIADPT